MYLLPISWLQTAFLAFLNTNLKWILTIINQLYHGKTPKPYQIQFIENFCEKKILIMDISFLNMYRTDIICNKWAITEMLSPTM